MRSGLLLAWVVTAYAPTGDHFADGTPPADWSRGNPRIAAAAARDLDAGRVHYGDRVCVHFAGGSSITYTIRDRCPDPSETRTGHGCRPGHVDLHVESRQRARAVGPSLDGATVTAGACRKG